MTIPATNEYFRETHIIGSQCNEYSLDSDHFPVLLNAPFRWIGHSTLYPPYRIVRLRSIHSHIIACLSGTGRTLIDGKTVDFKPGQVLLGPVGGHHAFEVKGKGPWKIAWVFFNDTEKAPVLNGKQARLIEADSEDFSTSLKLLIREAAGSAETSTMSSLVMLLDTYSRRMIGAKNVDPRLQNLWIKVEEDLAFDWDVPLLAKLACMSEEHLRRLCHKHYQRSPIDLLSHLRFRRAETLLKASPMKIDDIARCVGYASQYSFSAAFSRRKGMSPSAFRKS